MYRHKLDVPLDLILTTIEALEDAGCMFWACKGETLRRIPMVTCNRCASLAKWRKVLRDNPNTPAEIVAKYC